MWNICIHMCFTKWCFIVRAKKPLITEKNSKHRWEHQRFGARALIPWFPSVCPVISPNICFKARMFALHITLHICQTMVLDQVTASGKGGSIKQMLALQSTYTRSVITTRSPDSGLGWQEGGLLWMIFFIFLISSRVAEHFRQVSDKGGPDLLSSPVFSIWAPAIRSLVHQSTGALLFLGSAPHFVSSLGLDRTLSVSPHTPPSHLPQKQPTRIGNNRRRSWFNTFKDLFIS